MNKLIKKALCLIPTVALVLVALSACSEQTPSPSSSVAPTPQSESSASQQSSQVPEEPSGADENARIGFITQEYEGDNIAEIPYIESDGEANPEIESINRLLNQGIQQTYEDFMNIETDREWIEIKSYPFTSDNYLQVVVTHIVYPTYGTAGDMFSINYNKKEKRAITISDVMEMLEMNEDDLLFEVGELFEPEFPGQSLDTVDTTGFLLREGPNGQYVLLLLEITLANSEGDPWKGFYAYAPESDELYELDNYCLFDPYDMDQWEPPLTYQKNDMQ